MDRMRIMAVLLLFCLMGCGSTTRAGERADGLALEHPDWSSRQVAEGVRLMQRQFDELFGAEQFVSVLEVEQGRDSPARVRFTAVDLFDVRREPVPAMAERAGAVAAINGGFGHGGPDFANSGILKIDGEVLRFLRKDEARYAFVGSAAIGIDENERWHFRQRPGDEWPEDWPEVKHALAGGHRLLMDGVPHPSISSPDPENPTEVNHVTRQHPRTAIGLTAEGTALLVTVDGRHPGHAAGMTLPELAEFMQALGCVEAVNLDGGGSTTMWLGDTGVVNHPSDNRQFDAEGTRSLRNAVVVQLAETE